MASYKKYGNIKINGKNKVVYHKEGSTKNYVSYKGRHIGLTKYKKIVAKKLMKKTRGGDDTTASLTNVMDKMMGGKSHRVKRLTKCKKTKTGKKVCKSPRK